MEKKKKEKKILLRCYDGEKHVVEDRLDCHIHFEIVVEAGLLVWILRHCIILLVIVSNGCFLCSSSSFTCLFKLFPAIFYSNVYEFVKPDWLRLS